ncbi:hypothetical protein WJX74_002992 [Apatococcus lobatus]|uniref:Uncharacterized protein n=1 Tax=Apatococcus lobatus TaxID=904363 RepID=A0AAW1S6E6_9CHLO
MGGAYVKQQRTPTETVGIPDQNSVGSLARQEPLRSGTGGYGLFDKREEKMVVHIWLVNDSVEPPTYMHIPAVLDTGREGDLSLPHQEAQKLGFVEDRLMPRQNMLDAGGHLTTRTTCRPIAALVPMLDKPGGQLAFYKAGRLQPTSPAAPLAQDELHLLRGHSPAAAQAENPIKAAGEAAISRIKDRSNAWVQLSPAKHPRYDSICEYPLMGLAGMDRLGLHVDKVNQAIRTAKLRTSIRAED